VPRQMNNMVYPGMFRDGPDAHHGAPGAQGQQQHDTGNMNPSGSQEGQGGSGNFDPQMMAAMQAQMQGQGQGGGPGSHHHVSHPPPGMGGHGGPSGMGGGMVPGGMMDPMNRRTQNIISAALAAATPGSERGQYHESQGGPQRGMNPMEGRTGAPGPGGSGGMNAGAHGPPPGMQNPYGMGPQGMGGYGGSRGFPGYGGGGGGGPSQYGQGGPQGSHGGPSGDAYLHAKQMQMAAAAGLPPAAVQGMQFSAMYGKRKRDDQGHQGGEPNMPISKIRRPKKNQSQANKKPQPPKKRAKTFPEKLMQAMMENPNEDAVAWLPDGKSFVVVRPNQFVDLVLKKVFKECKYSSFVRKLHRWGFVRLTSGTGTDCFHHPLFQKNRTDLCLLISCTPRDSKGEPKVNSAIIAAGLQNEKPPSLAGVEKFIRNALAKSLPPVPTPSTDKDSGKGDAEKKDGDEDATSKPDEKTSEADSTSKPSEAKIKEEPSTEADSKTEDAKESKKEEEKEGDGDDKEKEKEEEDAKDTKEKDAKKA